MRWPFVSVHRHDSLVLQLRETQDRERWWRHRAEKAIDALLARDGKVSGAVMVDRKAPETLKSAMRGLALREIESDPQPKPEEK